MFDRLPAKGPILAFAAVAVGLAVTSRFAGSGLESVQRAQQALAHDGGKGPTGSHGRGPEQGLDPALMDALPPAFAEALRAQAGSDAEPDRGAAEGVGAAESRGEEGIENEGHETPRIYPPFDAAGADGHGIPEGAIPRNIGLRFVDENGDLLIPEGVRGVQRGPDGRFAVRAYRTSENLAWWTLGSPALTAGSKASFEFEVMTTDGMWAGSLDLDPVPATVDLDVAQPVELNPR